MNPTTIDKVIPLRAPTTPPAMTPFESTSMLASCRDMAAELLSQSLAKMLDKVEESLFDLAEKSVERDAYNLYMEARGDAHAKRSEIEAEFRRQFVEGFNQTLSGSKKRGSEFQNLVTGSMQLSLVDENDYEESLAVTKMASQLKNQCSDEILALNQRIGMLMQLPEDDHGDNPLAPHAICDAFRAACQQLESGLNVRLIVLRQFEQLLAENVNDVYQSVNNFLIQKNVLPTLPQPHIRQKAVSGFAQNRAQAIAGSLPTSAEAAGSAPPAGYAGAGGEQDLLNTLQHLLLMNQGRLPLPAAGAPHLASAAGQPRGVFADQGGGFGQTPPGRPSIAAGQSVLDALTHMQQGRFELTFGERAGHIDSHSGGDLLREIKQSKLAGSLGYLDEMTIDIVAMLFDYLFEDKNLAGAIKALIGRLQIPVLKVAMLDSKFFAKKQHPTRKLLDALANAGLGWHPEDGVEDRLYCKIAAIVEHVIADFDENIKIFETALQELEDYLAEEDQQVVAATEQAARDLFANEQVELAAVLVDTQLQRRLQQLGLPPLIYDFLDRLWRPALVKAFVNHGETSKEWTAMLQTMDELLWSVEAKFTVEDRVRLVGLLPGLLKQLEKGAEDAGCLQADRDRFFSELVHCHAAAIKNGLKPAAAPANMPSTAPVATSSPLAQASTPAVLSPPLPAPGGAVEADAPLAFNRVVSPPAPSSHMDRLVRGVWVEFRQDDGGWLRSKLSWISPMRTRFLFSNRQGNNGLSLEVADLHAGFACQKIRFLDETPLLDRAVSNMIDLLQHNGDLAA